MDSVIQRTIKVIPKRRQPEVSLPPEPAAFSIDGRLTVKVDFDLAMRIADLILSSGSQDKQIIAFGYQLKKYEVQYEESDDPDHG